MRPHVRLVAVLALVALSTACGTSPGGSDPTASPSPSAPAPTASVTPPAPPGGTPTPGPPLPAGLREQPRVAAAIDDTATREGVTPDEVVIAAWTAVTWNDGSLGCPKEGMVYTQATVDGELLILRVDTGLFQYHARTGGPFTYCASPSAGYRVDG